MRTSREKIWSGMRRDIRKLDGGVHEGDAGGDERWADSTEILLSCTVIGKRSRIGKGRFNSPRHVSSSHSGVALSFGSG